MNKKASLIFIVLAILVTIITILIINKYKNKQTIIQENPINYNENVENISNEEQNRIQNIIQEKGININNNENTNLYEVKTEYDGREYITVKDSIKFKIALAGIIKKDKPEIDKLDKELENAPKHTGIWIEQGSRDTFLKNIKEITNADYSIDQEGFLKQEETFNMNSYDKKIKSILLKNELFVFTINSEYYIIDEITGEILQYPFEEMDPYQGVEIFESNNKSIYIISENNKGKTNIRECIENIIKSIN